MSWAEKAKDQFYYWKSLIAFYILLSIALLGVQIYVLAHPELFHILILNTRDLTFLGIFGSNFVNRTVGLAIFNIAMMWMGLLCVFAFSKNRVSAVLISLFLLSVFPFIVSGFNVAISPLIQSSGFSGFSGISSAFIGIGTYYLVHWGYIMFRTVPEGKYYAYAHEHPMAMSMIFTLFALIPIPIFLLLPSENAAFYILQFGPIEGIKYAIFTEKVNVFVHAFGYVFGLLLAYAVEKL